MDLQERVRILSGAGKRGFPERRKRGIYTSFTVPGLDGMVALRDTSRRMSDFGIPTDLSGKTLIDVGSNVGAVSLELARRGASVTGIEYCPDRVALATEIAGLHDLDAAFHQHDLRSSPTGSWAGRKYDLVVCCSVDEYLDDVPGLYSLLRSLCAGTLYLESNIQKSRESDAIARLQAAGFKDVTYLGNGHSGGVSRKRKLYRAT